MRTSIMTSRRSARERTSSQEPRSEFWAVRALVNNAGIATTVAEVEQGTVEGWTWLIAIDRTATRLGMKHMGPAIRHWVEVPRQRGVVTEGPKETGPSAPPRRCIRATYGVSVGVDRRGGGRRDGPSWR